MNQLTKNLALEWAKDNIRVNAVAPGNVVTKLFDRYCGTPRRLHHHQILFSHPRNLTLRSHATSNEVARLQTLDDEPQSQLSKEQLKLESDATKGPTITSD
ncbi:hypothetical protein PIB30_068932 [Stylosanthes scabra]|uniref:Uncharacterized protein n=1 Tax=Stylosanthes scabra TaxID=79078 RepID=A0ABU6TMR2_9FABA|nr:hypothetical protein [Stylosanthes scabra]